MNRSGRKVLAGLAGFAAAAALLAGCGSTNEQETDQAENKTSLTETEESGGEDTDGLVIRVGGCDFAIWNPQFNVALAEGFFEDEFAEDGITIESYNFANGPAGNEAFTAGELDFFNGMGDQPFVAGVGNGIPITLLAATDDLGEGNKIVVGADSGIEKIEDLKGKKIGAYIGTQQHKQWLQKLSEAGISADDVEFVNLTNFNEQYAAFARGDIDTFFATTYNYNSIDDGTIKQIGDFGDFPASCYIIGSTEFIEKYPEITQRFINVLVRAQKWIDENPEESYKILSESSGLEVEQVKQSNEETNLYLRLDDDIKQGILDTYDFLKEQGTITVEIDDLESHFDSSFIDKALAEE